MVQLIRYFVLSSSFISSLRFFFRVLFIFLYFLLALFCLFHCAITPGINAKKNTIKRNGTNQPQCSNAIKARNRQKVEPDQDPNCLALIVGVQSSDMGF